MIYFNIPLAIVLENNGLTSFNKNNNKCIFKSNNAKEFSNIKDTK